MNIEIILIVGLPGSGKTTFLEKIIDGFKIDDFSLNREKIKEFKGSPQPKLYISDPLLCFETKETSQKALSKILGNDFNIVKIEWLFFENNIDICFNNVKKRNDSRVINIHFLRKLSESYAENYDLDNEKIVKVYKGEKKMKIEKVLSEYMPKGRYFIGDLSYVINSSLYNDYTEDQSLENSIVKIIDDNGVEFQAFFGMTFDNDYTTKDNLGNKYCVSSGTIGAVLLYDEEIVKRACELMSEGLAKVVDFDKDFFVSSGSGILQFGNILIKSSVYVDSDEDDDPWGGKREDIYFENDIDLENDNWSELYK